LPHLRNFEDLLADGAYTESGTLPVMAPIEAAHQENADVGATFDFD
jgi:hypothetical protein